MTFVGFANSTVSAIKRRLFVSVSQGKNKKGLAPVLKVEGLLMFQVRALH